MPTANCNGLDLYYEVHGEGEPLLCVMGLTADSGQWAFNVGAFAEHHRTIIFDNRDVGRSQYVEEDYEIFDMARDALGLADELGLDTFHLLGVSMGGAISQELALHVPDRIRTLQLAVTWGGGSKWWRSRRSILWGDPAARTPREEAEHMLMLTLSEQAYESDELREQSIEHMLANPNPQTPEGFRRQAKATNWHETRDRLPNLKMPVHVLGAEQDVLVPVWKAKEIASLIPGSKLTVVEGAAHAMHLERAMEFNELVLGFIAEHETATQPAAGQS